MTSRITRVPRSSAAWVYAIDFNEHSLDAASNGVYSARHVATYSTNYREASGSCDLSDYYNESYELAKFKDFLRRAYYFSHHNLVTDGVFGEMNMIWCRNVLIYFDKTLQDGVPTRFMRAAMLSNRLSAIS
jgi:chemotaxis protein methyltransferase CheR